MGTENINLMINIDRIFNRKIILWNIYYTPKIIIYIFRVGKSDLIILYLNFPKKIIYIFEVYFFQM